MPGAGTDKTKRWAAEACPIVVLVEPQLPENIGAAARAMANFGLSRLRLVAPRQAWPNAKARMMAAGADRILDGAELYDTLEAAIADCTFVFAATARAHDQAKPVVGASEAAALMAPRIAAGEPDPASAAAVSGLDFTRNWPDDPRVSLGEHHAAIPPYTGHGMALALENAAAALDPLLAYTRSQQNWAATALAIRHAVAAQQDTRLRWARRLHPWLLNSFGQTILLTLADAHLLPFNFFYRATHGGNSFKDRSESSSK